MEHRLFRSLFRLCVPVGRNFIRSTCITCPLLVAYLVGSRRKLWAKYCYVLWYMIWRYMVWRIARSISICFSPSGLRGFEDRRLNYKRKHRGGDKANISMYAARFTSGWKGVINRYYLGTSYSIILFFPTSCACNAFIRYFPRSLWQISVRVYRNAIAYISVLIIIN